MSALKLVRGARQNKTVDKSALELILMSQALDSFKSVTYDQANGKASLTIELQAKNDYRWHEIRSEFNDKSHAVSVLCEFFKVIESKDDDSRSSIEDFVGSIRKIEALDHASLLFHVPISKDITCIKG